MHTTVGAAAWNATWRGVAKCQAHQETQLGTQPGAHTGQAHRGRRTQPAPPLQPEVVGQLHRVHQDVLAAYDPRWLLTPVDPHDPVPIGEQISYRVLFAIAKSVYQPGDKLPTVREVAARTASLQGVLAGEQGGDPHSGGAGDSGQLDDSDSDSEL